MGQLHLGAERSDPAQVHVQLRGHLILQRRARHWARLSRVLCFHALRPAGQGEHLRRDDHQPHGATGLVPAAVFLLLTQVYKSAISSWPTLGQA